MVAEGGVGSQETCEARMKCLFGSGLLDAIPDKSFPSTSWPVASGDVERHRWARNAEEELVDHRDTPCASAFYDCNGCFHDRKHQPKQSFEDDLNELSQRTQGGGRQRGAEAKEDDREGRQ
jgi:hypothetical protein